MLGRKNSDGSCQSPSAKLTTSGTYQPKSAQIIKTNANYINVSQ